MLSGRDLVDAVEWKLQACKEIAFVRAPGSSAVTHAVCLLGTGELSTGALSQQSASIWEIGYASIFFPPFFFFFSPFFLLLITLTSFQCLHWSFSQAISSCCTLKNCDNMSVICGQTDRRFKHCFSRPVLNLALVSRDQYLAQRPANSSALCDCQHHKTLEGCTYINYVAIAMWYFVKNCCETPGEWWG